MKKIQKSMLFLVLSFIILFIITLKINTGYALQEVIDDYQNEDNVQVKKDVIRNSTFNAMELNWTSGEPEICDDMDIWTTGGFTRIEQGVQHIKNVNGTRIWFDDVDRDEGDRIFKDYGVNYFDDGWLYYFRVYIVGSHTSNARCIFMMISESNEDQTDMITNDRDWVEFFIQWKSVGSEWEVYLRSWDEGVATVDGEPESGDLQLDHWYHVVYQKVGDNITAWFYNDALRTDLDFMLSVVDADITDLRYLHPLNSQDQSSGGRAMDLYLNKVCNVTSGGLQYVNNGYFYTVEMLSTVNGSTVVLLTNATIPVSDSIKVEFSSDNSTWVDHNGNAGFDLLVAGNESLDIRDLGYTDLHVRYNFTDEGADSTPRLYQMIVITSGEGVGNGNGVTEVIATPFIVFGLIIGLILGFGLMKSN